MLLRKHLERDYEVLVVREGESALDKARSIRPDLILLCVDGTQVCEKLKSENQTRFIPVIVVTSLNDLQRNGSGIDADDFLVKPFDKLELFSRVRNLIRIKSLMEDRLEGVRRLEMERERHATMRDLILAVSGGKLLPADESELQEMRGGGRRVRGMRIDSSADVGLARAVTEEALLDMGMDRERIFDMVLCVSEASTNALRHAQGGQLDVYEREGKAQVWVSDKGRGIDFSLLPRTTPAKGWSSKTSLGYGYTILLELLDRVILSTGRNGTTVVMEVSLQSQPDVVSSPLDRFLSDWKEPGI